jgi:hypothetical protein
MNDHLILDTIPVEEPKRSQFLKVLCILSFIMCGIMVLLGIWGVYQNTPEAQQKNIEQVRNFNPEMADKMENNMIEMQNNPFNKVSQYLGLVYTLLSFLGVLWMWNRMKKGFYLYLVAELLPYTSFIFMGKSSLKMMGPPGGDNITFAIGIIIFMAVTDIVFFVLYARNLKEMDK